MVATVSLPRRWARGIVLALVMEALVIALSGRIDLPMLHAFAGLCAVLGVAVMLLVDPELVSERLRGGQAGEDPARLLALRLLFLALFVYALLDVGRLHWSDGVPRGLQLAGLALFALGVSLVVWAMRVNRFFLPVICVQSERRHHVVSTGPYAAVRHPGYAGMALAAPAAALAIGSWGALTAGLALTATLVARVVHEDRFLTASLTGYPDYAARVRFRLLPGAW